MTDDHGIEPADDCGRLIAASVGGAGEHLPTHVSLPGSLPENQEGPIHVPLLGLATSAARPLTTATGVVLGAQQTGQSTDTEVPSPALAASTRSRIAAAVQARSIKRSPGRDPRVTESLWLGQGDHLESAKRRQRLQHGLRRLATMSGDPGRARSRPVERPLTLPIRDDGEHTSAERDAARRVFLIHGRDDAFTGRMRELLSLLGLRVMEWEPLVDSAGIGPSPVLGDVIHNGLGRARAIVALLTPDDVVSLHPDLHLACEDTHEVAPTCQPRPNVLMELGAALFAFRDRTIVVKAGAIRPMADIGGVNYIAFDGGEAARAKLVSRLRVAGCEVDDSGQEWRRASRFAGLGTFERRPVSQGS